MSAGLDAILGPAYAELAVRVEADLAEHVAELNERRRNLLTLRGLGVTSVSALLSATLVSKEWILALFAGLVICAVIYSDLDANRHIEAIEKRLPFLEGLVLDVRRCLARGYRDKRLLDSLKTDLHRYKRTPPGTDEVPWGRSIRSPFVRWRLRSPIISAPGSLRVRHAFGGFEGFYGLLALGCIALGAFTLFSPKGHTEFPSCEASAHSQFDAAEARAYCGPGGSHLKRSGKTDLPKTSN